jgi:hypothetical protein
LTTGEKFGIASVEHAGLNSHQVKQAIRSLNNLEFDSFEAYSDARFKVSLI